MNTTYSVNNEVFAAKDLIFGWCFLGEKLGMEQYVPLTMLDKERVKVLQELFIAPLYPDDLKQALAKQLVFLEKQEELRQIVGVDTEPDELLTVLTSAKSELGKSVNKRHLKLLEGIADEWDENARILARVDVPKIPPKHITKTFTHFDMRAVVENDEVASGLKLTDEIGGGGNICEVHPEPSVLPVVPNRNPDLLRNQVDVTTHEVKKPAVQLKDFTMPPRSYTLVSWVTHGDDCWKLMQRFGSSWSKVPDRKDIRYIRDKTRNIQFLLRLDEKGDPTQIELYIGMTFEQFKEEVSNNTIETKERLVYSVFEFTQRMDYHVINILELNNLW